LGEATRFIAVMRMGASGLTRDAPRRLDRREGRSVALTSN
jgi:hypothetical protein